MDYGGSPQRLRYSRVDSPTSYQSMNEHLSGSSFSLIDAITPPSSNEIQSRSQERNTYIDDGFDAASFIGSPRSSNHMKTHGSHAKSMASPSEADFQPATTHVRQMHMDAYRNLRARKRHCDDDGDYRLSHNHWAGSVHDPATAEDHQPTPYRSDLHMFADMEHSAFQRSSQPPSFLSRFTGENYSQEGFYDRKPRSEHAAKIEHYGLGDICTDTGSSSRRAANWDDEGVIYFSSPNGGNAEYASRASIGHSMQTPSLSRGHRNEQLRMPGPKGSHVNTESKEHWPGCEQESSCECYDCQPQLYCEHGNYIYEGYTCHHCLSDPPSRNKHIRHKNQSDGGWFSRSGRSILSEELDDGWNRAAAFGSPRAVSPETIGWHEPCRPHQTSTNIDAQDQAHLKDELTHLNESVRELRVDRSTFESAVFSRLDQLVTGMQYVTLQVESTHQSGKKYEPYHAEKLPTSSTDTSRDREFLHNCKCDNCVDAGNRKKAFGILAGFDGEYSRTSDSAFAKLPLAQGASSSSTAHLETQMTMLSRDIIKMKAYSKAQHQQQNSDRLARIEAKLAAMDGHQKPLFKSIVGDLAAKFREALACTTELESRRQDNGQSAGIEDELHVINDKLARLSAQLSKQEERPCWVQRAQYEDMQPHNAERDDLLATRNVYVRGGRDNAKTVGSPWTNTRKSNSLSDDGWGYPAKSEPTDRTPSKSYNKGRLFTSTKHGARAETIPASQRSKSPSYSAQQDRYVPSRNPTPSSVDAFERIWGFPQSRGRASPTARCASVASNVPEPRYRFGTQASDEGFEGW